MDNPATLVMLGATATVHPPGAPGFLPDFYWGSCCSIFSSLDRLCPLSFGHCVVCPSSIYGF